MQGRLVPPTGTVEHRGLPMNAAAYIDETRLIARKLEDKIASKLGCINRARAAISRRIGGGFLPGTLERLRKGRLKRMDGWVSDRIRSLLVAEIQREIEALQHDLAIYHRAGNAPVGPSEIEEAEALLARARSVLEAATG